ncbi:MAG: thiamine phosphate synthase [Calditrichaeota bacterium]|nr:MAG: thiamine phosphate synthase [Calditrichota bacterium]
MKPDFKLDVYLVTDRTLSGRHTITQIISAAVKGGISIVQLREKECSTREFIEMAMTVKNLLPPSIPLIINDRADVALAVDAHGLHIGQSDMPYALARNIMGADKIIGLSVESIKDVRAAQYLDVDYLGVSPIFVTPTKSELTTAVGLSGLAEIALFSRHRLVAIGGLNEQNAEAVIKAGAEGIAVVSAICSAGNPEQATRNLVNIVHQARKRSIA